ncbi:microtubule organization protein AKNA-like isoform X2 [Anguilla rostrata]|uniref:microtubule organization protein AKNA-like isoform X2 n=1 Tax=Anguilla rostrata TaxID=7938 RepID=UPI0030CF85C7
MAGDRGRARDSGESSSASSGGSGASWQRGWDEDFCSQMDENGIIGLSQVAEEAGLEVGGAEEGEGDAVFYQDPLQVQSFHLSDLQDSKSPGGDSHALSLCDLDELGSESQASEEDEGSWLIRRLPERDRELRMTDNEEEEEEDTNDHKGFSDSSLFWGAVGPRDRQHRMEAPEPGQAEERDLSPVGRCHGDRSEEEVAAVQVSRDSLEESHEGGLLRNTLPLQSSYPPLSTLPPAGGPWHFPESFSSTPVHSRFIDSPGFESDAVTECVLETQAESHHGQWNHGPRGGNSPDFERVESQDRRDFSPASCSLQFRRVLAQGTGLAELEAEDEQADGRPGGPDCPLPASPLPRSPKPMHGTPQVPSPSASQRTRKVWQSPSDHAPCLRVPKVLRTSAGESPRRRCSQDSSRYGQGQLNYPLPDLSKVQPRVHFPKAGYTPPKSRGGLRKKNLASVKPLVFKSPADIVREVLSGPGAPPLSQAPLTPCGPRRPLSTTMPQEFRSPRQASALVHQLQEDYNRLLTKYAEAENTIDRLRLEAKVNLYSDPPKPSYPDYTGTLHMGSKVMTMTFPRAQRAELDPIAVSIGADPEETVETGGSPSVPSTSAYAFACSLGPRFGEHLTEALSRQAGRFQMQVDAFEELLRGGKLKPFEVLKGLSCLAQGQGSLERGYLKAREEHRLLRQQGTDPGRFDPHRELEGEIFCSGMRLEELKERVQTGEQVQPVTTAPPLTPPGTDLTMDPSTFCAPCPLSESQPSLDGGRAGVSMGVAVISAGVEKEGEGETNEEGPSPLSWAQRHGYQHGEDDLCHPLQQVPEGTRESTPSPSPGHSQQEPLPLCPTFPRQQSQDQRWGGAKSRSSSSASAAESVTFEDRASKPPSGLRRAPPQDRLVSPETDSGFVGSESSHLNLAAPSPAQQEAIASQSPPLEGGGDEMLSICTQSRLGPACQGLTWTGCPWPVPIDSEVLPSGEKGRLALPRPPRHWPSDSSGEFGSESDRPRSSSEGEEESQSVRYNRPANRRRPSLTGLHRHGDPSGVQGSGQPADQHMAIQSLQDEVSRLGEQLEGSLRRSRPSFTITAPPLVLEDQLHSHNSCALYPRFSQYQKDERREEEGEQEEEGEMEEEEELEREEEVPCKRSSPVPHLRPELDITTDSQRSQTTFKPQYFTTRIPESSGAWRRRKGEERVEPVEHGRPHTGEQGASPGSRDPFTAGRPKKEITQRHQHSMAASGGPDEVNQRRRRSHAHSSHAPDDIDRNPTRAGTAGGVVNTRHSCPRSGYRRVRQSSNGRRDRADSGLSTHRTSGSTRQNVWPMGFTRRKDGGVFVAAPPPPVLGSVPLVQYVPISPSVLHYSAPACEAPLAHLRPPHLVLDGGGRGARRRARALSTDRGSLGDSLTRAIEAARHMRAASRRMARSLSASVRHQGALSFS